MTNCHGDSAVNKRTPARATVRHPLTGEILDQEGVLCRLDELFEPHQEKGCMLVIKQAALRFLTSGARDDTA
jgi:hypothetical protein